MGCCTQANSQDPKRQKDKKVNTSQVQQLKQKLLAEREQVPFTEETQDLLRKAKAQPFNCRFVGLMFVHNYMMFLRDKSNSVIRDGT